MESINKALDYLRTDLVRNANIINFIENYPVYCIERVGNSVVVKGTSDRNWVYLSCRCEEELTAIKEKLEDNDVCFAAAEDWMIPTLTKNRTIKWKLSTLKFYLPHNVILPGNRYVTSNLKVEDAYYIYNNSNYKEYLSIEYIQDRIKNGIGAGIYDSDRLAAWCITQDDGAIGFLHVLPEYRLRGYGRDVTIKVINKVRELKKMPFVHIEEKNEKSMKLAFSLGFVRDRYINWIEIK
ncbi:MAG: family N-acetyltransferase [Clostridiaceae bacterium]|jgi:8-oxo-dGTP diphosphatase|nr:family N-acetyltransferase [Clostridiaceae bacterium]